MSVFGEWRLTCRLAPVPLLIMLIAVFLTSGFLYAGLQWNKGVRQTLTSKAAEMMGGELALQSQQPVGALPGPPGLALSRAMRLSTILASEKRVGLASVRFVDDKFPLKGEVIFAKPPADGSRRPHPGEIWVSEDLAQRLEVRIGDDLALGRLQVRVSAIMRWAPGVQGGFGILLPWAMAALEDVKAADLLGPGARVDHEVYVSGPPTAMDRWKRIISSRQVPGDVRWLSSREAGWLGRTLGRVEQMTQVLLASLVLLGLAAMSLSAYWWSREMKQYAELLAALGLGNRKRWYWLSKPLLLASALTLVAGVATGFAALWFLREQAGLLALWRMPAWDWQSTAVTTGWVLVPLWVQMLLLGPARHWYGIWKTSAWLGVLAVLVWLWHLGNPQASAGIFKPWLFVAGGSLVVLVSLRLLLVALRRLLPSRGLGGLVSLSIKSSGRTYAVQWGMLFLGLALAQSLALLSASIASDWRASWPPDTPNVFLFNVFSDQRPELEKILETARRGAREPSWYPVARGRITAIDGVPVVDGHLANGIEDGALKRDLNVTWTQGLPNNNVLIAGRWWNEGNAESHSDAWPVSVEEGVASRLGVDVGTRIEMRFGSKRMRLRVQSLRKVDWTSLQPNFFFILRPAASLDLPYTWLTSVHVDRRDINRLLRQMANYPTVSVVDVDAVLQQVRSWISMGLKVISWSVVLLGLMALMLTLAVTAFGFRHKLDFLRQLRVLGAGRRTLKYWIVLDVTFAAATAWVLAWSLALAFYASLPGLVNWQTFPWPWLPGTALGAWLLQAGLHWPLIRRANAIGAS